jgi:predicted lipoprotein with Yx(FWY)xxD motif
MKKLTGISVGIAMLALVVNLSQCSKKSDPAPTTPAKPVSLMTSATLGSYLANSKGQALYFFANDANGANNCPGGCAVTWPAFSPASALTADQLGAGLNLADFGTVAGGTQATYKGWPLYTYSPGGTAEGPGTTAGEGVGQIWFVAKPDYSIMLANTQLIGGDGVHYKSDYTVGDGATVYFTDAKGATLYAFAKDSANHNKFTHSDFLNNPTWPIYDTAVALSVPSILDKSQFSSTTVFGHTQLTYKGWPLYHFGADAGVRAATKGITFAGTPGSIWPVATQGRAAAPHP